MAVKKEDKPSVDSVLAKLIKKDGAKIGAMYDTLDKVSWLPTGNMGIDYVLGGGVPVGRVVESYGDPSSGKTTMAVQTAALLQKSIIEEGRNEYIVYADYEHAFDPVYAEDLGIVSHKSFIMLQPAYLEQGATQILELIETGQVKLIIIDSVAAMTPLAELEGDIDDVQIALQARLLTKFLRKLSALADVNECTVIFINHSKEKIDMSGRGRPGITIITTPGGKGLKYYASVRLEFKQIGIIKEKARDPFTGEMKDQPAGANVKVKTVKNKCWRPNVETTIRVRYGKGFDETWSALQVLQSSGKLHGSSGYIYFDLVPELTTEDMDVSARGWKNFRSERALMEYSDLNPEWASRFVSYARSVVDSEGSSVIESSESTGRESLIDGDFFEEG